MSECTEEMFLGDTTEHKITILRDDGVARHIRFRAPGTICYGFDLITWPGHLCISGDCGTYVFQRLEDMFELFRTSTEYAASHPEHKLFINARYWGQKLLCIGTDAGYREFDEDAFKERVAKHFNNWKECCMPTESLCSSVWKEVEDQVLCCTCDGEHAAYRAVYDFSHAGFQFDDFFDGGGTERYTSHYLWCLYAIAWGIRQYDAYRLTGSEDK